MDIETLVTLALQEDIGPGDVTTEACVSAGQQGQARVVARQRLVVSGQVPAQAVFARLGVRYEPALADGEVAQAGALLGRASGPVRGILTAERLALNFLGWLSGIATHTRRHVDAAGGAFEVVDTRKSTPLHRGLEKAAVRPGGGPNPRFALYDGVLVKDNHILAAGSIEAAVHEARAHAHHLLRVQVEVESLAQAREAIKAGADALLLDNMDDDTLATVVAALTGRVLLEASGGMDVARLERLRARGIHPDQVSIGGLIHQARWVDVALDLEG
ncbi:MAG: carboxylating nicotinate-nucleotide diphosphorylase [Pseudomonadota bacterium]